MRDTPDGWDAEWEGWPPLVEPGRHVDQRWVRRVNRALVLACIRAHGPVSRGELAARTALSRTTVGAITRGLLREGAIREGGRVPPSERGGRPGMLLHAVVPSDGAPEA